MLFLEIQAMLDKYNAENPANKIPMTGSFVWSHPAHMLATCFGVGQVSTAPGTIGSIFGALLFIVLSPSLSTGAWVVLSIVLFALGVWSSSRVARDQGVDDHKGVVIDEVLGIILLFTALPQGPLWWIAGFVAFRLFDIYKLPPVDIIDEKMKNGLGVMLDDLIAAFYAWIVVSCLGWLFS